jgi:hypothetical protein
VSLPSTNEETTNNEAGLIGAQKQHRGCQFLSFAHPADGKKIACLFGRDVLLFHPLVENVARRVNTAMAFTLMLYFATSRATLVSPSTPPTIASTSDSTPTSER